MITTQQTLRPNTDIAGLMSFSSITANSAPISDINLFTLEPSLQLEAPDFGLSFELLVTDFDYLPLQRACEFKFSLFGEVSGTLRLELQPYNDGVSCTVAQTNIKLADKKSSQRPQNDFVARTFNAILATSRQLQLSIPLLKLHLGLSFDLPLKELSHTLEIRQLAYRAMVVEKALGLEIELPENVAGNDVETIAYAYFSIVEREFSWFRKPFICPLIATPEMLSTLPVNNEPTAITYSPEIVQKSLFGQQICLGYQAGIVEDAVIDNYEHVKSELATLDGRKVNANFRSLGGQIRMQSIDTPRLPENPWPLLIEQLIALDDKLDNVVMARYFDLAAATLEGLTEAEKSAVTARPELGPEAFLF